jgi:hypothetical protein
MRSRPRPSPKSRFSILPSWTLVYAFGSLGFFLIVKRLESQIIKKKKTLVIIKQQNLNSIAKNHTWNSDLSFDKLRYLGNVKFEHQYNIIQYQGRIQDFKLGGALKKIAPSGGRRNNYWDISCHCFVMSLFDLWLLIPPLHLHFFLNPKNFYFRNTSHALT